MTLIRPVLADLAVHVICAILGACVIGPWIVRGMGVGE